MDRDGDRIRYLIAEHPEWVASALGEMGMDPFSARRYGRLSGTAPDKAALTEEVLKFMEDTKESREEKLLERGRKRAKATPAPRLPWGAM